MTINNVEFWKPVIGYEKLYEIGKLVKMFETGARNVDIARYFNTNRHLIGVYKYKWRRGELV